MTDGKVYVVNVLVGKILRVQRVGVQCTKDRVRATKTTTVYYYMHYTYTQRA